VIGTVSTFALGYVFSLLEEKGRVQKTGPAAVTGEPTPAIPQTPNRS